MDKPLIIIGAGEHASVLLDILLAQKRKIIALTARERDRRDIFGIPIIADEDVVSNYKGGFLHETSYYLRHGRVCP